MLVNKFVARTRKRGEIDYYLAKWYENKDQPSNYEVEFLEGPHKGEKYSAIDVAKAQGIGKARVRR